MRRISTILFILALLTGPALAQSNDDILKRLDALEKENAAPRSSEQARGSAGWSPAEIRFQDNRL
jgi:hypothetical protein